MTKIILFNKPYGVLSQFTDTEARETLATYIHMPGIYAAGRLDRDSEGLMVLTNNGRLQARIADPKNKMPKTYLAQVEHIPSADTLKALQQGVTLKDGKTRPAQVMRIDPPTLWPRIPPIRERKSVPDCWIKITLTEGRNRQVRRMTAHVGHPTLRLIRWQIGEWTLDGLSPGKWRVG